MNDPLVNILGDSISRCQSDVPFLYIYTPWKSKILLFFGGIKKKYWSELSWKHLIHAETWPYKIYFIVSILLIYEISF